AAFQRVVSITEQALAKHPRHPGHLRAHVRGLTDIAQLLKRDDPRQAEANLMRARAIATRFQAEVAAGNTTSFLSDGIADALGALHRVLGDLLRAQGRNKEAQEAYRQAIAVYERFAEDYPSDRWYHDEFVYSCQVLAASLTDAADAKEVDHLHKKMVKSLEKMAASQPREYAWKLWHGCQQYALWLEKAQQTDEAEKTCRRALDVATNLVAQHPKELQYRQLLVSIHVNMGTWLAKAGKGQEAEALFGRAAGSQEKLDAEF